MNTLLRAWWWARQGLDGSLSCTAPEEVLASTGWARSVGGSNPYLTLHARSGCSRPVADAALARLAIHELPSARGCTYVVPERDYALALQAGVGAPEAELKVLDKLGVPRAEIEELGGAVREALTEPLTPKQLRDRLGEAVRGLGEEGRKRGQSTTLPAALGVLQSRGAIRRIPQDGRLDRQRFAYARWENPPHWPGDAEQARTELARRYFEWAGAASLAHLRWFTGFTAKAAKAAIAELGLVELDDGLLALPAAAAEFAEYVAPDRPDYRLVHALDGLFLLRRDIGALIEPADRERVVPHERGKTLGALTDFADHVIVDRGTVVGFWQFDPERQEIAAQSFVPEDEALRAVIAGTEAFIREELGDHSWNPLDSHSSRAPRIAALRNAEY
ncbi:DNA glycosylase AlkZ-like family protein [Sciscionella marina]|uniref:DNA glycosylase AlkZ-like family protein n=1 Tax=Sciscionella marina TaxID=508770 RepID=UPI000371BCD6|nr:crosslink repair DNA glycosylase YcaQ family protein [Sciscionella marina]